MTLTAPPRPPESTPAQRRAPAPSSDLDITTPTARRVLRRLVFWVALVVIAAIVTLVLVFGRGSLTAGEPLSISNADPTGSRALAQVLRAHGVEVSEAGSLSQAQDAAASHSGDVTTLVYDRDFWLSTQQAQRLTDIPGDIVLVQPGIDALHALAPGVEPAGSASGALDAACSFPAAQRAGTIDAGDDALGYDTGSGASASCFTAPDGGGAALVITQSDGRRVIVLGSTAVLANGTIPDRGAAALALGMLGAHGHLVWYIPGPGDDTGGEGLSIAQLTPGWVTPLVCLGLLMLVAAGLWRGRRLGALVVERMPVVVRASEIMEGRARLYARNSTRLHALDALRIGTLRRLIGLLGLPRHANVDEVVVAVADLTGRHPGAVHDILVDAVPRSDADLVRQSDELERIEDAVRSALHPPGSTGRRPTPPAPPSPTGEGSA